jgi:hypothetical protein
MVQSIQPPLVCLLHPDSVYQRRRRLLEALAFEKKLEQDAFKDLDAQCDIQQAKLEELEEERNDREFTASCLDDAMDALRGSFTVDEITELKAAGL